MAQPCSRARKFHRLGRQSPSHDCACASSVRPSTLSPGMQASSVSRFLRPSSVSVQTTTTTTTKKKKYIRPGVYDLQPASLRRSIILSPRGVATTDRHSTLYQRNDNLQQSGSADSVTVHRPHWSLIQLRFVVVIYAALSAHS